MTAELRQVWDCIGEGCGLRVRQMSGEPIPLPRHWQDDHCPRCRVALVLETEGKEAADRLSGKLFKTGRGSNPFNRRSAPDLDPDSDSDPDGPESIEPKTGPRSSAVVAEDQERVRTVALAHPDWTSDKIGEEIGLPGRFVSRYRRELDLPRPKPGAKKAQPSAGEKARIKQALDDAVLTDAQITERLGVPVAVLYAVQKEFGLPSLRTRRKEQRQKRVAELLAESPNLTDSQIGKAVGEQKWTIKKDRRALGLPPSPDQRRRPSPALA